MKVQTRSKPKNKMKRFFKRLIVSLVGIGALGVAFLFLTPYGHQLRTIAAETILNTQHQSWAKYTFLSEQELADILTKMNQPDYLNTMGDGNKVFAYPISKKKSDPLRIDVENVKGESNTHFYKGKLMTISNPFNVMLATEKGTQGSKVGEQIGVMAKREGALAGVNASGFIDPTYKNAGKIPIGIVIDNGVVTNPVGDNTSKDYIMGLTKDGQMVTGMYSPAELLKLNVKYAAGFMPQLIVNGEKMIKKGDGGSGINPRTAVGQKEDGTMLFLVIDGRQSKSIGATLKEVQDILYDNGAVNAFAMDGGDSSVMYLQGDLISSPSASKGTGRYLPNSWLVVPNKGQKVELYVDGEKQDPSVKNNSNE